MYVCMLRPVPIRLALLPSLPFPSLPFLGMFEAASKRVGGRVAVDMYLAFISNRRVVPDQQCGLTRADTVPTYLIMCSACVLWSIHLHTHLR